MSRNNRGMSMRVRVAVAATVLVGGGAAGVVAIASRHSGAATAQSAGYVTNSSNYTFGQSTGLSTALNEWSRSPDASLSTLSKMKPVTTVSTVPYHHVTLAAQLGTARAVSKNALVVRSSNHLTELWLLSHGTKFENVGGNRDGVSTLTNGTMSGWGHESTKSKTPAAGDTVFVIGEREHGKLIAQLVLFTAPQRFTQQTPTATPSATATSSATATWSATAKPSVTATPDTTVSGTPAVTGTSW